jgi:endonuclease I/V8-like Glu-specific endopeptidase
MIFDADMNVVAQSALRWEERTTIRERRVGQPVANVEAPERIAARLDRLAEAAKPTVTLQLGAERALPSAAVLREIGLERTIGSRDFQDIAFFELALAVSRFVGRINIRSSTTRTIGFGTGSMVSPRLLLTNNHVLPTAEKARFSAVEFDYQLDRTGQALPFVPFAFQPDVFFMTDIDLDFTLVAVAERSSRDRDLKHYGWSRLISAEGKILIGEHVNIIQHPRGQFKQFVARENKVVDLLEKHLHYVTDTEPGSSGSPVYNDQWEIVALHHSGVPKRADGKYINKNGNAWDGRDPDDIEWIANEGVRVSKLVEFIGAQRLDGAPARLREDLLTLEPMHPVEAARQAEAAMTGTAPVVTPTPLLQAGAADRIRFTIPLTVTVEIVVPVAVEAGAVTGDTVAMQSGDTAPAGADVTGGKPPAPASALASALADLAEAPRRTYYDAAADTVARDRYYAGIDAEALGAAGLFHELADLVARTHKIRLAYAPSKHVYPWVDLHKGNPALIRSIYSGRAFDPAELIEADFRIEAERLQVAEAMAASGSSIEIESAMDLLEAQLPYNCEHVVPQSWFAKKEPMRGDLHHLFACESGCNSFRGNSPYFDFPDFQEALRDACGKRERVGFEPTAGKGAVARATLYFLLRYPGLIGDAPGELGADRLATLLVWHARDSVGEYERHRNTAIFEKQGNRNPLIDYPSWATRIEFGLGIAPNI